DEAEHTTRVTVLEQALTDEAARARVDSGRLAEPFWYVDSPLTTPNPGLPFGGRPPRGHAPRPCPGVIAPDAPVELPDGLFDGEAPTRLRTLLREGVTLLLGPLPEGTDADAARDGALAAARQATGAPVAAFHLADIDATGALTKALDGDPGQVWVLRPDAHIAAVVDAADTGALAAAVRTCLGRAAAPERPAPAL
ncbi:pentachlorophenol monooxygenase, partial [Nocardiopsis sp. frass2]